MLYKLVVVPPLTASSETFIGEDAVIPVMDIAGVEGKDEDDNFLLALILGFGVILVMVDEPDCCIVSPNAGVFCWIGVTDIP